VYSEEGTLYELLDNKTELEIVKEGLSDGFCPLDINAADGSLVVAQNFYLLVFDKINWGDFDTERKIRIDLAPEGSIVDMTLITPTRILVLIETGVFGMFTMDGERLWVHTLTLPLNTSVDCFSICGLRKNIVVNAVTERTRTLPSYSTIYWLRFSEKNLELVSKSKFKNNIFKGVSFLEGIKQEPVPLFCTESVPSKFIIHSCYLDEKMNIKKFMQSISIEGEGTGNSCVLRSRGPVIYVGGSNSPASFLKLKFEHKL